MNGPEHAARIVADHLTGTLPAKLVELAAELGVDGTILPAPALITEQERDLIALREYPALFVVVQRLSSLRRADGLDSDGTIRYVGTYPVRVFTFVRSHGYAEVDLLRKRYVRAVREVLFAGQEVVELDETSYAESYSDVGLDDQRRSIAGAWHEFTVELDEGLADPDVVHPPAPAGWEVVIDESTLPHPAFD